MKRVLYIFLAQTLLISILFGQTKVAPPPTKIALPSDTTRTGPAKENIAGPKNSQLELPDVLILGKDRLLIEVSGKGDLLPEGPTLVRPGDVYKPVSIWFKGEDEKPSFEDKNSSVDKITWGGLEAGAYTTTVLDAGHWRKIENGDFRVHGWWERSNGQYNNSHYGQGGLTGKLSHQLAPKVTGTVKGNYEMFRRGLHGAVLDELTRRTGTGFFGADLEYDMNKLSDGKLGFKVGGTSLTTDTSKTRYNYSSDTWYKLFYGYTTQLAKLQISTNGNYIRETYEFLADSLRLKSSFGDLGLEVLAPINSSFTAAAGVKYQTTSTDSLESESKVSPFVRINFMPNNKVGVTGSFYNGLEYLTYSEWWQNNPYISHTFSQRAQDVEFGFKLDLDIQLLPAVGFSGGFSRRWMNRMYYWESEPLDQLFNLQEFNDVRLTEFQIGSSFQLTERTRLQIDFISYSDKLDSTKAVSALDRIPYRPNFRIPIRASVQLLDDMWITLDADIYGERRSNLNSSQRLPSFGLINAQITKDFGDIFSAVISVRNLLDSDYVVWENYPAMGVTVLGGVRVRL
jgi:hypothetical protein